MAIYHLSVKTVSRSAGRSATGAAAYRSGENIKDERTGLEFNYENRTGVESTQIFLPENSPEWAKDRSKLWNAAEKSETRINSTVAREFEIAIPSELNKEQRTMLVHEFTKNLVDRHGFAADVAIHTPNKDRDERNFHAHILCTTRQLSSDGFTNKTRELDTKNSGEISYWREAWAKLSNQHLAAAGHSTTIDHRSLGDQLTEAIKNNSSPEIINSLTRKPTTHLGPAVVAMEQKGITTDRGDAWREIKDHNAKIYNFKDGKDKIEFSNSVLDKVTNQKSVFTERDLFNQVCKQSEQRLGSNLYESVAHCIGRENVILLGTDAKGNTLMTTREMQDMERSMIDKSVSRKGEDKHRVSAERVDFYAKKHGLSGEQGAALQHINGKDGVTLVEGMAGTGKSTMMKAANDTWREAGYEVRGVALAGKAADGLEQGSGIKSQTVHSLLYQLDNGKTTLNDKTILCVDEAGMLSSNLTSRLVAHADKANAKLVMIGDDRQLQPIQAGGAFKAIKDEVGAAKLTTIYRQRDEWARDAVHSFADGKAEQGLKDYEKHGLVHVGSDAADTKRQLIDDWNSKRSDDGRSSIILAGTRKDVGELNEMARSERIKAGEIEPGVRVKTDQGERDFSQGDRLLFLKNDKDMGVKNGHVGTIETLQRDGDAYRLGVRTDNGSLTTFNTRDYDKIDHGYATTVHKAQGATVDRA